MLVYSACVSIPAGHDLLRQLHGLLSHIDCFPHNISMTTEKTINIFGILDALLLVISNAAEKGIKLINTQKFSHLSISFKQKSISFLKIERKKITDLPLFSQKKNYKFKRFSS